MPHFDEALTYLRDRSTDLVGMGRSFERLMKTALSREPGILGDRFSQVWMWDEWPDHDGPDTGIDLVAEEREGGLCAIQCKFFDPHRPVPKGAIDSFMSASEPEQFTSRLIINTGGSIQKNALKTLEPPAPAFRRYLKDRYEAGAKLSTLRLAVAALRKVQTLASCRPTAKDQLVADTITGLEKGDTTPLPRQVAGLTADALSAIRATARKPRKGRRGVLETDAAAELRGNVDIALCQVLADAGLRRSEAASLVWDDVELWTDGSGRLTVRRSKTDTEPRIVYLTPAAMRALDTIRPAEVDGSEPVFGLSVASISRRVKQVAESAGLGPGFSGHSGRVGMARRMAAAGAPTHEIMAQGRWKTARMVEVYTRAEEAGRAAKWLT